MITLKSLKEKSKKFAPRVVLESVDRIFQACDALPAPEGGYGGTAALVVGGKVMKGWEVSVYRPWGIESNGKVDEDCQRPFIAGS